MRGYGRRPVAQSRGAAAKGRSAEEQREDDGPGSHTDVGDEGGLATALRVPTSRRVLGVPERKQTEDASSSCAKKRGFLRTDRSPYINSPRVRSSIRRRKAGGPASSPSTLTDPLAMLCTPPIARKRDDFPLPLAPRRPLTVPASILTESRRSTVCRPRTRVNSVTTTASAVARVTDPSSAASLEDHEYCEVLVGAETVIGAGWDEYGVAFAQLDALILDIKHAIALEYDVDLVVLVRLLTIRLGRDQDIDTDLQSRRLVNHLIAAVSFAQSAADTIDVKRVRCRKRPDETSSPGPVHTDLGLISHLGSFRDGCASATR
jgi:hypothetical protein